jgi:hypothetical protein
VTLSVMALTRGDAGTSVISDDPLVAFAQKLIRQPSISGEEGAIVELIAEEMSGYCTGCTGYSGFFLLVIHRNPIEYRI